MSQITYEEFKAIEKRFAVEFEKQSRLSGPLSWTSTQVMQELHERMDFKTYMQFIHEADEPRQQYENSNAAEEDRQTALRNGIMAALYRVLVSKPVPANTQ